MQLYCRTTQLRQGLRPSAKLAERRHTYLYTHADMRHRDLAPPGAAEAASGVGKGDNGNAVLLNRYAIEQCFWKSICQCG